MRCYHSDQSETYNMIRWRCNHLRLALYKPKVQVCMKLSGRKCVGARTCRIIRQVIFP